MLLYKKNEQQQNVSPAETIQLPFEIFFNISKNKRNKSDNAIRTNGILYYVISY